MGDDAKEWGLRIIREGRHRYFSGVTNSVKGSMVWTLPPQDRPNTNLEFEQPSSIGPVTVYFWGDGGISVNADTDWVRYDGIDFDTPYLGDVPETI
jgi:hypothetical protein